MKKTVFPFFLTSLFLLNINGQTTDSLLNALDVAIAHSHIYVQQKEERINNLKQMLCVPQLTPEQRYDLNKQLSFEYKSFILDSAIHYTRQNRTIARNLQQQEAYYSASLDLARLYSITNLFVEASDLLRNIPVDKLSQTLKIQYYDTYLCFYNYYSHHIDGYEKHPQAIRDTLLQLHNPESDGYKALLAEKLMNNGKTEEGRSILLDMLNRAKTEDGWRAVVAYLNGASYVKDGNYDMQIRYFAMSALADVKNAIKENASLHALALALYNNGDIERAYRYIQKSMEDAVFSNAHLRSMEISQIFPIIDKAQQAKNEQQNKNLRTLNICILLLSVILIATLIYVYRQMAKLSHAKKTKDRLNRELKAANREMNSINHALKESNTLKEEYIARYMNEASGYLDKLEEYRRELNRIAMNGKTDELYKALKSSQWLEKEVHNFYCQFDRSFLQLFPTFIDDFNSLLHEEERIVPKQKEMLNTELRIFALIRLGITDSTTIAHFLRYPVGTIYNYRAKVRNKAIGKREQLEEEVMKIGLRGNK